MTTRGAGLLPVAPFVFSVVVAAISPLAVSEIDRWVDKENSDYDRTKYENIPG